MKIQKGLVLPDLQCRKARNGDPTGEDTKILTAVRRYVEHNGPYDWGIQLGDWLDLPYFSRFDVDTRLDDAIRMYEEDLAHAYLVIQPFVDVCKEFTIIEGNHDFRFQQYLQRYPHLKSILLSPEEMAKDQLGADWCAYWSNKQLSVRKGKAEFIHGQYANKYHAEKHAREFLGSNVFYGHVHDKQSYSPIVRGAAGHTPAAASLGCLCRLDQPWLRGASTNWTHSFAEFFVLPNGKFTFYDPRIFDDGFVGRDGKWWGGK